MHQPSEEQPADARGAGSRGASRAVVTLAVLAVIYTLHFAATLLVPLAVAALISLLFNPIINALGRAYVPRIVSAVLLLVVVGGPFTLLGAQLAEPAQRWAEKVPELASRLSDQFESLSESLVVDAGDAPAASETETDSSAWSSFLGWFGADTGEPKPAAEKQAPESEKTLYNQMVLGGVDVVLTVVSEAPLLLAQIVTTAILLIFLTVYGPGLYDTAVNVLPLDEDRKRLVDMASGAQSELSRYILTVSAINACLGLVTAGALWLLQFEDPLLWGTMVALLNFAPYVGPLVSTVVIVLAGLAQTGLAWTALLPAAVYFTINAVEAQFVTPAVLGKNMRMNPLVIILWLTLWGWLWGVAGVLIAVPLLVCVKLVLGQFPRWQVWLRMIESRG